MSLRLKIFSLTAFVILIMVSTSFYFLNSRFSNRIEISINESLIRTEIGFKNTLDSKEELLSLKSSNIASSPKLVATMSLDEATMQELLTSMADQFENTEFLAVLDLNGKVIAYTVSDEITDDGSVRTEIIDNTSKMNSLSGFWILSEKLISTLR